MAFGFIKKVFSFGRKEVVEEKPDGTAPLPPLDFEALNPAEEAAPGAPTEPTPEIQPEPAPETEPASPPEQPAPPRPQPEIPPAKPQEVPPEPARPEPEPAQPEPTPEVPPAPTPRPEKPEVPAPAPETPKPPAEVPPSPPQEEPASAPVEIPAAPETTPAATEPPAPEIPSAVQASSERAEAPTPTLPTPRLREGGEGQSQPAQAPALPPKGFAHAPPAFSPEPAASSVASQPPPDPVSGEKETVSAPQPLTQAGKRDSGKVTVAKKVEQKAEPVAAPVPEPKRSWFQRMREGLARSSKELSGSIAGVFTRRKLDEETLQDLEDVLIRADLGVETALRVTDALAASRYGKDVSDAEVRAVMAQEVEKVLKPVALPLELDLSHKPHVVLVVGVNGTGKTTTIGKLAAKLTEGGLSVMLAAGDTFRAAAIEQLKIWGERTGSPVVSSKLGADAAGLAYDAFEKAKQAGSDVLVIDTAGRLHNKAELMAELEKIVRVLGKLDPEAPHTVLQTVDATTGQNALNQVDIFRNVAGVNGLVMTKLDGTARGGILVAIAAKHKLPVYFIGVGEQVDDLEPFSAGDFAKAIAGVG